MPFSFKSTKGKMDSSKTDSGTSGGIRETAHVQCPVCRARHLPLQGDLDQGVYSCTCVNCGHFFKFRAVENLKNTITFTVNGKQYSVGNEFDPATSILEYLRKTGISTGTKGCCYEGGCGMCLVTVSFLDPVSQQKQYYAVNGCCLQLYTCDGVEITTIEGLGNTRDGLHPIQQRMAQHDGAQCGFCTPGQIMNMYGLLKNKKTVTSAQVEDAFDSTICRCTGYRSILDAMKSLAVDAPKKLGSGPIDIEELDRKMCSKTGSKCIGRCSHQNSPCEHRVDIPPRPVHIVGARAQWFKPLSLAHLILLVRQYAAEKYRLVFGNSSFGVFGEFGPWNFDILIDIRSVNELYTIDMTPSDHIVLGSNLTITNLQEVFANSTDPALPYGGQFAEYIKRIASNSLRNLVCWTGNLVMKNAHNDFASDVFTMFATVDATLTVADSDGSANVYTLENFLQLDLKGKVIESISCPKYTGNDRIIRLYKTAARLQLCHAHVASGFNFQVDANDGHLVKSKPNIIIQGINGQTVHAVQTEGYLTNRRLEDKTVLQTALTMLNNELTPASTPWSSPAYRKSLAIGHFYKFVLECCQNKTNPRYTSGGPQLSRPLMSGSQTYDESDPTMYPVSKPMMKVSENYLVTGEAKFLDDEPVLPGQLFAMPVLSTEGNADIKSIDPSGALSMPGVVAFIKASDIPGVNNWRPTGWAPTAAQELLADKTVEYAGAPIGIIVADEFQTANSATYAVRVEYENIKPVVVDIEDAIQQKAFFPAQTIKKGDAGAAIAGAPIKITGRVRTGDQYHFHVENQCAIAEAIDTGGMWIQATTQWIDAVLEGVAQVLGLPGANVTVETKRLGGGFGGKILYNIPVSSMAAVAAHVTRSRVKMTLDIHRNMQMQGKRTVYLADYEVGVDNTGKLLGINVTVYSDAGCKFFLLDAVEGIQNFIDSCYFCPNWILNLQPVKTNKPTSTPCRAPGSIQAMFIMEEIMDHVTKALKKDALQVRQLNFYQNGQTSLNGTIRYYCIINEMVQELVNDINFAQRLQDVQTFNQNNRWKKRGIHISPNSFSLAWNRATYRTMLEINHLDGSVSICHGGIDMGQGISTKAIQTTAYKFSIPVDQIFVKKSSTSVNGNSVMTGGSIGSDVICESIIHCCDTILERMAPVRARFGNPPWPLLVALCLREGIDLTANYYSNFRDPTDTRYYVYSACCSEVELDVITGQYQIRQLDYLYDCGQSLNPELDMGQVEGAFIMGMGYFLQEHIVFDHTHGNVLNDGTWEYKPPLGKDLPIKFNIKFLRKNPFPKGVLRSKASGEPPVALGATPLFALKRAVEAARAEVGNTDYVVLDAPATVEKVQLQCLNDKSTYTLGN